MSALEAWPPGRRSFAVENLTAWKVLRQEVLFVAWATMEIALVAPMALAFMPWARFWPTAAVVLWLLLLMAVPFNLGRVMTLLGVSLERQRVVMVAGLLAAVTLALRLMLYAGGGALATAWIGEFFDHAAEFDHPYWRRDMGLFALVVFVWWRGISLVGRRIDIGEIGLRFRVLALIVAPLVAVLAGLQLPDRAAGFILLFISVSLVAIVLTRVQQLELSHSGTTLAMGPRWLLTIAATAALVALVTGLLASAASGQQTDAVVGWLGPLWLAIRFGFHTILGMVSYLSGPLIIAATWFFSVIASLLAAPLGGAAAALGKTLEPFLGLEGPEIEGAVGPTIGPVARQLLTGLGLLLSILVVSLALRQLSRRLQAGAGGASETVNPLDELAGRRPRVLERLLNRLGLGSRRSRAAASIRRIYQEMAWLAADYGYPRAAFETPYEYLPTLAEIWPDQHAQARLITEAYNRVRYGEVPETRSELEAIEAAWRTLKAAEPAAFRERPADVGVSAAGDEARR